MTYTPVRWTDIPLTPVASHESRHRFLLDFSDPADRHLHSPTAAIIRGSSQIDVVGEAIRRSHGPSSEFVFLERIERVKFAGALKKGETATIVVTPALDSHAADSGRVDCLVEMFAAAASSGDVGLSPASLIMSGTFTAAHPSIDPREAPPPRTSASGQPNRRLLHSTAEDRDALRRLKASAPSNEHLQQIICLRQLDKASDVAVECGEVVEALVQIDPSLLNEVGEQAYMLSAGNLIQTCYQIPKVFLVSRSSLSQPGIEFYARHITDTRLRPVRFYGGPSGHILSIRLQVIRIRLMAGNQYCTCTARVTDSTGTEVAVLNFSFLLDRTSDRKSC